MKNLILPDEWKKKAQEILSSGKTTIVLGDVDTGKTTFVTYLANLSVSEGYITGIVDSDVGQSDIGPPTTIGLGIIDHPISSLTEITPKALYFVGSISPEKHLLPMVVGTQKMVNKAFSFGAERVIVDTTGLVYGGVGRALKYHKIKGISPDNIVALQRGREIEHLLRPFEGLRNVTIHRLSSPLYVKRKSQDTRYENRRRMFDIYFKNTHSLDIPFSNIRTYNTFFLSGESLNQNELSRLSKELGEIVFYGERIPEGLYLILADIVPERKLFYIRQKVFQKTPEDFRDILVGLGDEEGEIVSLGIIEQIDFSCRIITIKTPFSTEGRLIKTIQFSEFKMSGA